jgi:Putative zinc-finger
VTSMTDASGHPDVDELSALTEGLLAAPRSDEIRRHLSGCPDCSDTCTSLEEIRTLLGELPAPTAMPTDVAARIDAALAAEALLAAGAPLHDGAGAGAAVGEFSDRTAARSESQSSDARVSRETSPSDAPGSTRRRPAGRPRGATGPGRSGGSRGGRRRRSVTLGVVFTAAVIGLGSLLLHAVDNGDSSPEASKPHPTASRHAFSSDALEGQVDTLLQKHPKPLETYTQSTPATPTPSLDHGTIKGSEKPGQVPPKTATPLDRPEAAGIVPDCVRQGIGRGEEPLAAEQGTYDGTDAYLVVLPHSTDSGRVSAYVVDAACTEQSTPSPGTVLLTRSYPKR